MAEEADVLQAVGTPVAKGMAMVELESITRGASSALLVHVAAATLVTLAHRTPDGRRNVA